MEPTPMPQIYNEYDFPERSKIPLVDNTLVHVIQNGKCNGLSALNNNPKTNEEPICGRTVIVGPASETWLASMKLIIAKYISKIMPKGKR